MSGSNGSTEMLGSHIPFKRVLFMLALIKAGVAGAGVGLAALGVADMAFAASAAQWWESVKPEPLINAFAAVGSCAAIVWRIWSAVWG